MTGDRRLVDLLDEPAERDPDRAALILETGAVCTYRELREITWAWAATLLAAGVERGDRISLADWGGIRAIAVTLAATAIGASTAQMNPLLPATELGALAEVAGCGRVAVAGGDALDALGAALGSSAVVLDRPSAAPPPAGLATATIGGDREALVLFTSGTTGRPKAVPVSNASIVNRVSAYRAPFDIDRAPGVSIICVPSFHVGGMLALLLALHAGDTTVIQPRFDPGRWLALVEQHRVGSAFLVPAMLSRILEHPSLDSRDLSALRNVSYGAAAAPVDLVRRALARWPDVGFANVFGQTETLGAYTALSPVDHRDASRIGSVGRPLPGVEVRIVDPVRRIDVADGEPGELWVRSAQNVREGWLATGDLARRDADGYVFPAGRLSDVINRGGEKFGPVEVADVVGEHPAVAQVAVTGVPDPEIGERVGVAVVLNSDAPKVTLEEMRGFCRGRLASFKLPELLAIVEALPVNELGKLPGKDLVALIAAQDASAERTTQAP